MKIVSKKDIAQEDVENVLNKQLADLERLLRDFNDKKMQDNLVYLLRIINHEYLHQGELILINSLMTNVKCKSKNRFFSL